MRFGASVSLTLMNRLIGIPIGIAGSVLVARYLGPEGKGILAVIAVLSGLAVQVGNLGLHASTTYYVARDRRLLPQVVSLSLLCSLGFGTASAGVLAMLYWKAPGLVPNVLPEYLAVLCVVIPFLLLSLIFQNILLGLHRVIAYNAIELGAKVLGVGLILVVLVWFQGGVWEVFLLGQAVTFLTALTFLAMALRESGGLEAPGRELLTQMLQYGLRAYLACTFGFLIIRADLLLVNYFLGESATGIYSVSVGLADLLLLIPGSIGTMLFPLIATVPQQNGVFAAKVSRHTVIVMATACAVTAVMARPLIGWMYGESFIGAVTPFLWLLPGVFFLGVQTVLAQELAARGYPIGLVLAWGGGLILNVVLNLFWIPRWGIVGAAASSTVAYGGIFIGVASYFRTLTALPWKDILFFGVADARALSSSVPVIRAAQSGHE